MANITSSRINDSDEDMFWKNRYQSESYYEPGSTYDDYQGAYRTGYQGYSRYSGRSFDDAEPDLRSEWEQAKGTSRMTWDKAKHAARAAWQRVEQAMPGDADRDGR